LAQLYVLVDRVERRDAILSEILIMMTHGVRPALLMLSAVIAKRMVIRNGLVYVVRLLQMLQDLMTTELRQVLEVSPFCILFNLLTIGRVVTLVVIEVLG
jgi:hypothetical protein